VRLPATDRALEWLRTLRVPAEPTVEAFAREAAERFGSLPPFLRAAAVQGFLQSFERSLFGPDQSRLAQAATDELGPELAQMTWQALRELRAEIIRECEAARVDELRRRLGR
jgi:hypothetical protein